MSVGDVLRRLVQILDAEGVPYMVAGSFASGIHGVRRDSLEVAYIERWVAELGLGDEWAIVRAAG